MSILVTGGAGFIGANFVLSWLANETETLINLDKLTYAGNLESLQQVKDDRRYIFVRGDIGDAELVSSLLSRYRPRAIINFAAESHVDRSISNPDEFVQTNVVGTFKLLHECLAFWRQLSEEEQSDFRFLHVSTDEVYGSLGEKDPAFTELTGYAPNSPYSASKAASDHLVRSYYHTYGLPVLTTNCSNNYGPYQFPEKLIPLVIHNALSGSPLPVYGKGENIRDWLYVEDHCEAIKIVLRRGKLGETYNVGGKNEKKNIDVVEGICAVLDELAPSSNGKPYRDLIEFVKDRPGHDLRYAIDAEKIENELSWFPAESFETGLRKTIRWYLDHQAWVKNITSGDYRSWIDKNYGNRGE